MPTDANWSIEEIEVPAIEENQVLVKVDFLSIDPAMRGWMNDAKSYIRPIQIDEVFRAGTAGIVIESKSENLK